MRIRALLIVAAATAATAGCGNGEPASPVTQVTSIDSSNQSSADAATLADEQFDDETNKATVSVQARDNSFLEPYIEVTAGTKVEFTNKGRNQHDVVPVTDGAFKEIPPEDFQPKDEGSITFTVPGDYRYYCSLHGTPDKGMIGAIRVLE